MKYTISVSFLEVLLNLVRIQNEQLLKIICEDEGIKYESVKHLIPSAYELRKQLFQ